MADSRALYRLMSWLSPSYPVGAFAYSHGLEHAVETGRVTDLMTLTAWVDAVLFHGTGSVDGPLFRETYATVWMSDWPRLDEIAALGTAFQASAEFALESRSQGAAFLKATRAAWPADALDQLGEGAVYPVAVAAACAAHKIDLAPLVGADLGVMDRDARKMRGERPFVFSNIKTATGVAEIAQFIKQTGGLEMAQPVS